MKLQELAEKIGEFLPNAIFGEDMDGELVIHTNMTVKDGLLIDMDAELGDCDTCGKFYELASRDGRCGDCGDCSSCCTHEVTEE